MSELKTKCNDSNVTDFINSVEHEGRKKDALEILNMILCCSYLLSLWKILFSHFINCYHHFILTTFPGSELERLGLMVSAFCSWLIAFW